MATYVVGSLLPYVRIAPEVPGKSRRSYFTILCYYSGCYLGVGTTLPYISVFRVSTPMIINEIYKKSMVLGEL